MPDLIVAFVTTNNKKEANSLAEKIVSERLAACVNIVSNVSSVYEWDGELHNDPEYLLIIKTISSHVKKLKKFIAENHSYEVPEFIAIDVADALPEYARWVYDVTY
jgi:periplasmic divalent cation tolerance protein